MTSIDRADNAAPSIAAFIAKWRRREPEMAYSEVFCARPQRMRFILWGALLFELREAAFELSDARPMEAKCAWWADEALRCAQATPRHPLTQALAAPQLPWSALARGLVASVQADALRPSDRDAALASVEPLANGVAKVEAALFDAPMTIDASRGVAVHLLCERLRVGLAAADGGRVPLSVLARNGITSSMLSQPDGGIAVSEWATELTAALPASLGLAALYRRTRLAFDGCYLRERAAGRNGRMSQLRMLYVAWNSARNRRSPD